MRRVFLIAGLAGVGKTALLQALRLLGEQVIDLEALACHRGSAFGASAAPQPRHHAFVRSVRTAVANAREQRVWLEDEGPFIGSVGLPSELYARFATAPTIWIEAPREHRVRRIVEAYGSRTDLLSSLDRIAPRFGGEASASVRRALLDGELDIAAGLLLAYYDGAYQNRTASWPRPIIVHVDGTRDDAAACMIAAADRWEAVAT
jgi:tRNA 2-selenouridine synthase